MLTTEFKTEDYIEIDWKCLFGYHIPHLIIGKRYGPTWQYRYNIKHSKIGKQYWVCKLYYKKKAYTQHLYLNTSTANHFRHILNKYNIGNSIIEKAK